MSDRAWLEEYADTGSAAAFARLVREHGPLVYSTCLREVRDRHLAEDVAQVVFLLLARKVRSRSWRPRTVLAGWLYETARFASRNALRKERRRRARETKAVIEMLGSRGKAAAGGGPDGNGGAGGNPRWAEVEPLLHAALGRLRRKDRDAILLRYYLDKPLKEVGAALGVSADAAQARVARALEKLRQSLSRSNVVASAGVFAELLRANAVAPAPPGLAQSVVEALSRRAGSTAGVAQAASRIDLLTEGAARAMALLAIQKIVGVVACATVMVAAVVAAANDDRDPAAMALLDQFGEGQAKLQSFVVWSEDTARWSERETESPEAQITRRSTSEFRADAKTGRFARRSAAGANLAANATTGGPNGQAAYASTLWDGEALYSYTRAGSDAPDRLTIVRGRDGGDFESGGRLEREIRTGYAGAAAMGYFDRDEGRIDREARRASYLGLRPEREIVNGVACHVIDMVTDGGTYTLWLDPEHGLNIARGVALKKFGDTFAGRRLEGGCRVRHVVEVTRFEQVGGTWVPMEVKEDVNRVFRGSPQITQRGSLTHRKTRVLLNPDFDASGAFKPDDVRDGTPVFERAAGGGVAKTTVWNGGPPEEPSF